MASYIHGTDPQEQQRLSLLNDILNRRYLQKVKPEPGSKILDVGSGLGQLTLMLLDVAGAGASCVAVEADDRQLAFARTHMPKTGPVPDYRQGSALQLPLAADERGTFDVAHTRFLLEHVQTPSAVVKEMKQALRPGGRIWLADDDHQAMTLFPVPEGFPELWTAYMDAFIEIGCDPFIGRKLHRLLMDQGFEQIHIDTVFFGDCAGTESFAGFTRNLIEVIGTARTVMTENNLITGQAYESAIGALQKWAENRDAAIWYPLCIATGIKS